MQQSLFSFFLFFFFLFFFLILVWFYLTQILSGPRRKLKKIKKTERFHLFLCLFAVGSRPVNDISPFLFSFFPRAATSPLSDEPIKRRRRSAPIITEGLYLDDHGLIPS